MALAPVFTQGGARKRVLLVKLAWTWKATNRARGREMGENPTAGVRLAFHLPFSVTAALPSGAVPYPGPTVA